MKAKTHQLISSILLLLGIISSIIYFISVANYEQLTQDQHKICQRIYAEGVLKEHEMPAECRKGSTREKLYIRPLSDSYLQAYEKKYAQLFLAMLFILPGILFKLSKKWLVRS